MQNLYMYIYFRMLLKVLKYQNLVIITQNDDSQNGCFKKTKHAKISEK